MSLVPVSEVIDQGIGTDMYLETAEWDGLLTEEYLIEGLKTCTFDHHMWSRKLAYRSELSAQAIDALRAAPSDWLTTEVLAEKGLVLS